MACTCSRCGSARTRHALSEGGSLADRKSTEEVATMIQEERSEVTRACMVPSPKTHLRESMLTSSVLKSMRIGEPTCGLRPLGSRLRSAQNYYSPIDVEDGLGHHGGPAPGSAAITAPVDKMMMHMMTT